MCVSTPTFVPKKRVLPCNTLHYIFYKGAPVKMVYNCHRTQSTLRLPGNRRARVLLRPASRLCKAGLRILSSYAVHLLQFSPYLLYRCLIDRLPLALAVRKACTAKIKSEILFFVYLIAYIFIWIDHLNECICHACTSLSITIDIVCSRQIIKRIQFFLQTYVHDVYGCKIEGH